MRINALFIFLLFTPLVLMSQLSVSTGTVNAGKLGGKNSQASIRLCNSCLENLKVAAGSGNGQLYVEVPESIKPGHCAWVRITSGGYASGSARQTLLLNAGGKGGELVVKAQIVKPDNADCYDFGKGSSRNKLSERQGGHTNYGRTIEVKEGRKNKSIDNEKSPAYGTHLVALLDASGSMGMKEKLEKSKKSLISVIATLRPADMISVIIYSEKPETVVKEVSASDAEVGVLIGKIEAGGFTNGGKGIASALEYTRENGIKGRLNHIVLFTDGQFNLGADQEAMEKFLRGQSRAGDFTFSVVSGGGDRRMERNMKSLAKNGGGIYCDYNDARFNEALVKLHYN